MRDKEEIEGLIEDLEAEIRHKEQEVVSLTNEIMETKNKVSQLEDHAAGLVYDRSSINGKLSMMRVKLKDLRDEL